MFQVPKSQEILDLFFERAILTLIYSSCKASHENNKNNCLEESMNQVQSHIKKEKKINLGLFSLPN